MSGIKDLIPKKVLTSMKNFIPSHLQIETVNRLCNARCPMCPIQFVPDYDAIPEDLESHTGLARPAEIMPLERFERIIDKMKKYTNEIKFLSLHGCGEPLLDKTLAEKVRYARMAGFRNVGFTSNCSALTPETSEKLLKAGLTTIIPSIDGIKAATHEKIRPRTDFDKIVDNVNQFIAIRNQLGSDCKLVVRMVKQQDNLAEWPDYKAYWESKLDASKGDQCVGFEIHNTGGKVENYDFKRLTKVAESTVAFLSKSQMTQVTPEELYRLNSVPNAEHVSIEQSDLEKLFLCPDLFTRLSIFASGRIALCSADQAEYHPIGNILDFNDPVDAFNSAIFNGYRTRWMNRKISKDKNCFNCTVVVSRFHKHSQ
jgi:hypothetical protein